MRILFFLFFAFTLSVNAQNELSVNIHGVPASKGKVSVAIYDNEDGFLEFDKVFKCDSIEAQKGITQLLFENLPEGEYALAVFYDENGNNELDKNWLGIPKEKVAFSKGKLKAFGPPKFKECAFRLMADTQVDITF